MAKNDKTASVDNAETETKVRKRRKAVVPENETKAERFKRVCGSRMIKALAAIEAVKKCSGSGYEYGEDEVSKMKDSLVNAVNDTLSRFDGNSASDNAAPSNGFFG